MDDQQKGWECTFMESIFLEKSRKVSMFWENSKKKEKEKEKE